MVPPPPPPIRYWAGQETWNLHGRLRWPSFHNLFCKNRWAWFLYPGCSTLLSYSTTCKMVLNSGRLQNVETIAKLNPGTDFSDIHNWPQGTNSLRQKLTGLPSLLLSHPSSPNHEWNLEECHTLSNSVIQRTFHCNDL